LVENTQQQSRAFNERLATGTATLKNFPFSCRIASKKSLD
jgi:hypothetical protein